MKERKLREINTEPDPKKEVMDALNQFELSNGNSLVTELYLLKEKTKDRNTKEILTNHDIPNRLAVIHSILNNLKEKI